MSDTEPVNVGIRSLPSGQSELLISFSEAFQSASLKEQMGQFQTHQQKLADEIVKLDAQSLQYGWLLLLQQVSDQLAEYIAVGEMELNEAVVIEVEQEKPKDFSIMDLLG